MNRTGSRHPGILLASFLAGPIFLAANGLAALYLQLPRAILLDPLQVLEFVLILLPAVPIGFVAAVVPNTLGAALMAAVADRVEALRSPLAWTIAGAIAGTGLAALFGAFDYPILAFATVSTAAICGRLCRTSLDWEAQPFAFGGGAPYPARP